MIVAQDFAIATQASRPAPRVARVIARKWRTLTKGLFDSYHPERHYMRGPGPKWHEKHAYAPARPRA